MRAQSLSADYHILSTYCRTWVMFAIILALLILHFDWFIFILRRLAKHFNFKSIQLILLILIASTTILDVSWLDHKCILAALLNPRNKRISLKIMAILSYLNLSKYSFTSFLKNASILSKSFVLSFCFVQIYICLIHLQDGACFVPLLLWRLAMYHCFL